ncbi:thiol-disulfide oxidoreductase DCC family protein [Zunongwangia pacifica]|uniref:DUF393 domain-containing protein n=1 Tax=Zunongwangia pacifica TaxID=2911062 RepID=A0A9X1ZQ46_9FLAO|nr:DCC1-like thiol-disulfide oxidoreductase family protein [Zunongwangia pacifica]MCL6218887.1 DUF393 domain-containing protein [Zunongwangia pacifica]
MFTKIELTTHNPNTPVLVWDGHCGFCKFWKTRWKKRTGNKIKYITLQKHALDFPDIPEKEFKKASRLITKDGRVFSGPDSAYKAMWFAGNKKWHNWYHKYALFQQISDHAYNHIAKNRRFYYKLTIRLLGNDPNHFRPYWLFYVLFIIAIIYLLYEIL